MGMYIVHYKNLKSLRKKASQNEVVQSWGVKPRYPAYETPIKGKVKGSRLKCC